MDSRPVWRGHLRLALVSCPVALYPVHHERANLHFHFINPKTGNRVRMVTLDAGTGEEMERRNLVRGYEVEKDRYVLLDEDDFEAARIDSSSTLNVDKFVQADNIDPVYFDTSYYMAPDGDTGQDVYVVLRDAIAGSKMVALSHVVISRRERAIAIAPAGKGLIVHTLFESRDINSPATLFDPVPNAKPDPEMIALARQLIDRQTARFAPSDIDDRYEARLRDVIEAKAGGQGPKPPSDKPGRGDNVIDLMAALKKSLGQPGKAASSSAPSRATNATAGKRPKTPAKTATKKKAAVKAPPSKAKARRR